VCGGSPRAGTAGITSGSSSEDHHSVSEVRLFSLILCTSGFDALLRMFQNVGQYKPDSGETPDS
jgi:hypothetical protein